MVGQEVLQADMVLKKEMRVLPIDLQAVEVCVQTGHTSIIENHKTGSKNDTLLPTRLYLLQQGHPSSECHSLWFYEGQLYSNNHKEVGRT